jgi:hypothetical protein
MLWGVSTPNVGIESEVGALQFTTIAQTNHEVKEGARDDENNQGKGTNNMEEGMKDEVEATRNKEVEARTKGRRRGKKVEREMFFKERPKYIRSM